MIGFATLVTNQVSAIREWGIFSAIGTFFAVIIAATLIPALYIIVPGAARSLARKEAGSGWSPVDVITKAMARLSPGTHVRSFRS